MRFDVSHELRQPLGSRAHYDIQKRSLLLEEGVTLNGLMGTMDTLRTDKGLLASVSLTCSTAQRCSRCLADFHYPLNLAFQEEYLPSFDIGTGLPLPLPPGADNFLIDASYVLDLDEALRQYGLACQPLNALCKPDCRGLCPNCGHNLNEGSCTCLPETDARWEALTQLASSLGEEERS